MTPVDLPSVSSVPRPRFSPRAGRQTSTAHSSARRVPVRASYGWGVALLLLFVVVKGYGQPLERFLGCLMIVLTALVPFVLWASRRVTGIPIFPMYTVTFIWIYAIPLIVDHPMILQFSLTSQVWGAASVAGYLLCGTLVWYLIVRRPFRNATTCWMFDEARTDSLLTFAFGCSSLVLLAANAGWINTASSVFSLVRAVALALQLLICFVLSFRMSQSRLSPSVRYIFCSLMSITMLVNISGLLLIGAMSLFGLAVFAYIIGSRRAPWRICIPAVLLFSFLHMGKSAMREKHWRDNDTYSVGLTDYPRFFVDWVETSWQALTQSDSMVRQESLVERASLMHLLLYVQARTPGDLPFLYGKSYSVIPVQFVPRLFYPSKPRSHEATYILTVYYELQTIEDTELTTIDFGLLNEAYANFGYLGMALLAVVLGGFFGFVENWARGMPILSFRSLFAVLILGSVLQASSSAGFYLATLYQSTIVLFILGLVFMRKLRPDPQRNSFLK